VVLPAIAWQGLNPVDDDFDGFADTLGSARAVGLDRPFDKGRLPAGFWGRVAPLLRFLDRERLPYDLTTDVALAADNPVGAAGSRLRGAPGVVFPGSERWLPAGLERALRTYVNEGGRVASFGEDAFRRSVRLGRGSLRDPTAPRARNVFGEGTEPFRAAAAPLVVADDGLGVFGGDRFIGELTLFERSLGLEPGAKLLTAAGRENGERDFVGYRLGKGIVVRAGTPQWAGQLATQPALAAATLRIWKLLRRG
jgi:hypothetical protein